MADDHPNAALVEPYLWLVVVGCFFGFMYAFGIGANDVANAFASVVAAKSLTLKQAVIAAAIFEFSGAFFLGAQVTNTIRSKIFDVKLYKNEPDVLMLGMFTSLFTAMVMLLVATRYELPVSTTHTIVGCMIGFSIAAKGFDSIEWDTVKKIFISWVASPGISGLLAFLFFGFIRIFILRHENAFQRAFLLFPVVLFGGIFINVFYVLKKGINNRKTISRVAAVGYAAAVGVFCGLLWLFVFGPIAKRRAEAHVAAQQERRDAAATKAAGASAPAKEIEDDGEVNADDDYEVTADEEEGAPVKATPVRATVTQVVEQPEEPMLPQGRFARMAQHFADNTFGQDLQTISLEENTRAAEIWDAGEVFDESAEQLFTYIQVFTACLNSFAHGANDVANAIGPISAMVDIYQNHGNVSSKSKVKTWILAYGGIGIVVGLLFYGYRVMKSLGYKMTILSPSRGACAELAASLFVVTASFMSIPVSSTQSICGAVMGVGLAGGVKNVQWLFFLRVMMGWVTIFFGAVFMSCMMFALFAFTPSLNQPPIVA
jgi:solute carrier family 20 (sodium-dependent phosphate transporter)